MRVTGRVSRVQGTGSRVQGPRFEGPGLRGLKGLGSMRTSTCDGGKNVIGIISVWDLCMCRECARERDEASCCRDTPLSCDGDGGTYARRRTHGYDAAGEGTPASVSSVLRCPRQTGGPVKQNSLLTVLKSLYCNSIFFCKKVDFFAFDLYEVARVARVR